MTVKSAARAGRFAIQNALLMSYVRWLKPRAQVEGRVTVVTPTYKRPHVLREAIESVRAQTYVNWEHIIVSDGRDDRIPPLVAQFGDPRLRCYNTFRLSVWGKYQSNYALKYATGEFILYLDDDNVVYPHCLATMVSGFTSDDIGYVVCPIRYGDGILAPTASFRHGEIDLLNYMVRRRLVERVGGQNRLYQADFFLIDKVRRISRGSFVNEVIGHHR